MRIVLPVPPALIVLADHQGMIPFTRLKNQIAYAAQKLSLKFSARNLSPEQLSDFLGKKAEALSQKGLHGASAKFHVQAAEQMATPLEKAKSHASAGSEFLKVLNWEKALECNDRAFDLFEEAGRPDLAKQHRETTLERYVETALDKSAKWDMATRDTILFVADLQGSKIAAIYSDKYSDFSSPMLWWSKQLPSIEELRTP